MMKKRRGMKAPRARCSASPTRSCASSNACSAGGVEYVIINFGGSREHIRRFAREIMPAFADEPQCNAWPA